MEVYHIIDFNFPLSGNTMYFRGNINSENNTGNVIFQFVFWENTIFHF